MTQAVALAQQASTGVSQGFKNRIINGAMVIDQYNAGASVTPNVSSYPVDRWNAVSVPGSKYTAQQNAGSVTPPAGFANYLGMTSSSAYSSAAGDQIYILQNFEGFNTYDLGWGTANAKTITISFWVRSSLTGTFGGSLRNYGGTRSYPFTYTINSANTWEYETITIAGDTSGTWVGASNAGSLILYFNLGTGSTYSGTAGAWASADYRSATGATSVVGTNGATFYITGVQLEVGSTATSFDYRPFGTELALCQRYYEVLGDSVLSVYAESNATSGTFAIPTSLTFAAQKRAAPTMSTSGSFTTINTTGSLAFNSSVSGFSAYYLSAAAGRAFWYNSAGGKIIASIEL